MHRVRINKRRVLILRLVAYAVTLTLSVVTTALLIYAAMGYRLTRSGGVVRSGLLLVDTVPVKADISINGQQRSSAPGRFVLNTGGYQLELLRDGYRPWRNHISITSSQVERVRYPILIPDKLESTQQLRFSNPGSRPSVSPDRKKLLMQIENTTSMRLITFDEKEPRLRQMNLSDIIGEEVAEIATVAWSPNTKRVILAYTRGAEVKLLAVDLDNLENSKIVSESLGLDKSKPILFKGNDHFYAVNTQRDLRYISFDMSETETLLTGVEDYSATSGGRHELTYVRTSDDQKTYEVGASNGADEVTLYRMPISGKIPRISTVSYDGDWYSITSDRQGRSVAVYRNPLGKPILDSQLPFATIHFAASAVKASQSGRFLVLQGVDGVYTYDIETLKGHKFQLKDVQAGSLKWMTDFQLTYRDNTSKVVYMLDFDGTNQQPLLGDDLVVMSADVKALYSLTEGGLNSTSLLLEE